MTNLSKASLALKAAHSVGYRITADGKIVNPRGNFLNGGYHERKGLAYNYFSLSTTNVPHVDKRTFRVYTHRLQAYQRFGDDIFQEGIVVRHLDGDSRNNAITNIAIGTPSDNMMDRPRHERLAHAIHASRFNRRFTDEQVQQIREDHASGMSYNRLREKWGCSKSQLSFMLSKRARRKALY
jgi:hypothetical protein